MYSINKNYSNLKTLVINLDDYIGNYNKQKPFLDDLGLNIERFSGINAIKDQHLKPEYKSYISKFALNFQPKSVIGCALSHILCTKHIYENYLNDYDYFLIMEDDAFPIYKNEDFFNLLNYNVHEIELLDKNWDIIQLHSDAIFPNYDTYNTHYFSGSTAAYLISKKGIEKTLNQKIFSHADFIQHNCIKFNKYKVKKNLFWTNEKNSLNRKDNTNLTLYSLSLDVKTKLLEFLNKYIVSIPLRGEKSYANFLEFKILKLPCMKKEYTANEIIDYLFMGYLFKKSIKYIK